MRIGIIGFGFVGQAVAYAHRHRDLVIRDPKLSNSASLDQFTTCDAVYICVPSPAIDQELIDGHCDTAILEQTLKELLFVLINRPIPVICKTTAPPSVYEKLYIQFPNIVHCPEFLTAANHIADYQNSEYFILGGDEKWCLKASVVIRDGVPNIGERFIFTDIKTASLYKYMMNSYLATKVTFMNEFYSLAKKEGIEWSSLKTLSSFDSRIGHTHMDVPGPDNLFGWGGACFPKDVAAIMSEALDLGVELELLERVKEINKKHRKLK